MKTPQSPVLKSVKPISFLFYRVETTVPELNQWLWVAPELFQEALVNKLTITGPIHWHYSGFSDVTKPFTLEIALPVAEVLPDYDGKFHFKRTAEFKCLTLTHEGSWYDLPKSYEILIHHARDHQFQPLGVNRELYINADFNFPEANTTEIQLGIA